MMAGDFVLGAAEAVLAAAVVAAPIAVGSEASSLASASVPAAAVLDLRPLFLTVCWPGRLPHKSKMRTFGAGSTAGCDRRKDVPPQVATRSTVPVTALMDDELLEELAAAADGRWTELRALPAC